MKTMENRVKRLERSAGIVANPVTVINVCGAHRQPDGSIENDLGFFIVLGSPSHPGGNFSPEDYETLDDMWSAADEVHQLAHGFPFPRSSPDDQEVQP